MVEREQNSNRRSPTSRNSFINREKRLGVELPHTSVVDSCADDLTDVFGSTASSFEVGDWDTRRSNLFGRLIRWIDREDSIIGCSVPPVLRIRYTQASRHILDRCARWRRGSLSSVVKSQLSYNVFSWACLNSTDFSVERVSDFAQPGNFDQSREWEGVLFNFLGAAFVQRDFWFNLGMA